MAPVHRAVGQENEFFYVKPSQESAWYRLSPQQVSGLELILPPLAPTRPLGPTRDGGY